MNWATPADAWYVFLAVSILISVSASPDSGFAGDPSLDVTVESGGERGAGVQWSGNTLPIDNSLSWDNEIERSAGLDDGAPFVEQRAVTGRYHVTIGTV